MIQIIYMAAGNSRRFGENKLLYPYEGKALYRHTLELLYRMIGDAKEKDPFYGATIYAVTQYESIKKELQCDQRQGKPVFPVFCEESRLGASYTIKAGLKALGQSEDYVMFVVADQPHLSEETLCRLGETAVCQVGEKACIVTSCEGRSGNPCLFPGEVVEELFSLSGDQGGKVVLRRHPCVYVEAFSAKELMDIDTKEELS